MSTNNKVFQVLVPKGNKALATAGTGVDALTDGQLGIFDADTNLAIDGTQPFRAAYAALAVGTGDNKEIRFSAGQEIQKANITGLSAKNYTAGVGMEFELTGFDASCDADYGFKLEFRNAQVYTRQAYNQYSKSYNIRTACCEGCDPCPSGSKAEVAGKLFKEVFNDDEKLISVKLVYDLFDGGDDEDESNPQTLTTVAEVDDFMADEGNAQAEVKLVFTTNPLAVNRNSNIQMGYNNARATVVIPSFSEGFRCKGKFTITRQAVAEEGLGTDIKQKEYFAGGWNGKPGIYRASTVVGLEVNGFDYQVTDPTAKYNQIHLVYDQFSTSGWLEYLNNLMTIFAVPQADTTTRSSLIGVLNKMAAHNGIKAIT